MNAIDPFTQEVIRRDMHPNVTLALTVFMGAGFLGFYLYDIYLKQKKLESRIQETDHVLHETALIQEAQADAIREHDERIRAKQDYDEEDEIEEEQYQAWEGEVEERSLYFEPMIQMKITIWREKLSTKKKNEEWVHRNNENDVSVTVRDFYLGNSNPEFKWEYVTRNSFEGNYLEITTDDTFINGWDSTIKLHIQTKVTVPTEGDDEEENEEKDEKDILLEFLEIDSCDDDDVLMNKVLKKCIQDKLIHWSRVLIDA